MKTVKIFISSTFKDMNAERDYLNDHVFPGLKQQVLNEFGIQLIPLDLRWGVTEEDAFKGRALEICLRSIDECRPFFLCLLGQRYGWVAPLNEIEPDAFTTVMGSPQVTPNDKEFFRRHYAKLEQDGKVIGYSLAIDVADLPYQAMQKALVVPEEILNEFKAGGGQGIAIRGLIQAVKNKADFLLPYRNHPDRARIERLVDQGSGAAMAGGISWSLDRIPAEDRSFAETHFTYLEFFKRVSASVQGIIGTDLQKIASQAGIPKADQSITETEIRHAVLNNDIPLAIKNLRDLVIENAAGADALNNADIQFVTACYPALVLKKGLLDTEKTRLLGLLDRLGCRIGVHSRFFIRRDIAELPHEFIETDTRVQKTLKDLKSEIEKHCRKDARHKSLPYSYRVDWQQDKYTISDLQAFGDSVRKEIWDTLATEHQTLQKTGFGKLDPQQQAIALENLAQENFAAIRTQSFIGRKAILEEMEVKVMGALSDPAVHEQSPFVMAVGDPGGGKSALLSRFYLNFQKNHPDVFTIGHFIGAGINSTHSRDILRRLCRTLRDKFQIQEEVKDGKGTVTGTRLAELETDSRNLPQQLTTFIRQAGQKILIVLDAINQVDSADDSRKMGWLPLQIPANACLVLSAIARPAEWAEDVQAEIEQAGLSSSTGSEFRDQDYLALDAMRSRYNRPREIRVPRLDPAERRLLVNSYLDHFQKKPEPLVLDSVVGKAEAYNPLYLTVASEELRLFGSFERIKDFALSLPGTVVTLFDHALARLENSFPGIIVKESLSFIAIGKSGMHENDIMAVLQARGVSITPYMWQDLSANLAAYLTENQGVYTFFHEQFKEAVGRRYLAGKKNRHELHRYFAEYLEGKGWVELNGQRMQRYAYRATVRELPYQWMKAAMCAGEGAEEWGRLTGVLCDIFFVEAKGKAELLDSLQEDYEAALKEFPKGEAQHTSVYEFNSLFMRQKHILASRPELSFQQYYNELQWNQGQLRDKIESQRGLLIKAGGSFLHQYRKPHTKSTALISSLEGHTSAIWCCAFSPDGTRFISGSSDRNLILWDTKYHKILTTFTGHVATVRCCAFSPDGTKVISGCEDGSIKLWDAIIGNELFTLRGHKKTVTACMFSANGTQILSGGEDESLNIWDAKTGKIIRTFPEVEGSVVYCAFFPDGKTIISGDIGGQFNIFNVETGELMTTYSLYGELVSTYSSSPDGTKYVTGILEGEIKIFSVKTGEEIARLIGHEDVVLSCAFSPNGLQIISGSNDRTLKLWDLGTGKEIMTFGGHTGGVTCCAFSPDGSLVVSGGLDATLKIWDLKYQHEIHTLGGHSSVVTCCAVSSDGALLATGSRDSTLKIWNTQEGKEIAVITDERNSVDSCAFSPDNTRIVTGCGDHVLRLWDSRGGKEILSFRGHTKKINCCTFSPDSEWIASGSADHTLRLWEFKRGKEIRQFLGHSGSIWSIAFSPKGDQLLSSSDDSKMIIWDVESGEKKIIIEGHVRSVDCCAFSQEGTRIVSGSQDHTLRIWNVTTGKEINALIGHSDLVSSCAFSPDGALIVSASWDRTVKIWDASTGQELTTFICDAPVRCCSVFPNGKTISCGDLFGNIYMINLVGEIRKLMVPTIKGLVAGYRLFTTRTEDEMNGAFEAAKFAVERGEASNGKLTNLVSKADAMPNATLDFEIGANLSSAPSTPKENLPVGVLITSTPPGAEVLVNFSKKGATPLEIVLNNNSNKVIVKLPGYKRFDVTLPKNYPGHELEVKLELEEVHNQTIPKNYPTSDAVLSSPRNLEKIPKEVPLIHSQLTYLDLFNLFHEQKYSEIELIVKKHDGRNSIPLLNLKGVILLQKKMPDDAINVFRNILFSNDRLTPDPEIPWQVLANFATAFFLKNDVETGKNWLQKCPKNDDYIKSILHSIQDWSNTFSIGDKLKRLAGIASGKPFAFPPDFQAGILIPVEAVDGTGKTESAEVL